MILFVQYELDACFSVFVHGLRWAASQMVVHDPRTVGKAEMAEVVGKPVNYYCSRKLAAPSTVPTG